MHRHTRLTVLSLVLLTVASAGSTPAAPPTAELTESSIGGFRGLCVQVGIREHLTRQLAANPRLLVHCLDFDAEEVRRVREQSPAGGARASVIAERWEHSHLPHADNIANVVIVNESDGIDVEEALRVVTPGGQVYVLEGESYRVTTKPRPQEMDEWTHQWHSTNGGLVSNDELIGVPQGVQWLSGPLFAMAGRKSSTQTLVSTGGRNFYVTQNVLENVGKSKKQQYLVARDAFNGLIHWQRPWTGPFVTGDGETNPRMVASSDRLYVADDEALLALDTGTGEEVARLALEAAPDKLALVDSVVLVQSAGGVRAVDSDLAATRWTFRERGASGLVVSGGRVLMLVSGRSPNGAFRHDIVCLSLQSGDRLWRTNTQPQTSAKQLRINFAEDGFVAVQAHGQLHVYSAETGEHLWSRETEARPGKSYSDERFVGHFYRHGLVWMLAENSPRKKDGQNLWLGLNPRTGKVERELPTQGEWPRTATPAKMGCQLLVASDRYIMIPRQATFVDFQTGEKHPFKFTRGGCGLGFVPANGLVYSHPHACGCFSEAIRGFMAVHDAAAPPFEAADGSRLEKGPAAPPRSAQPFSSDDWPMYRGDGRRGGYAPVALSDSLTHQWSARVAAPAGAPSAQGWSLRTGNTISAPTVRDGTAFAADVDGGRVVAVDTADGAVRWEFTAAGRVDSPPTLHGGLCLFGSHDGFVYALNAEDGRLVWRFRAAPRDRRIVAYGSLEATWPVAGTVLVQDGRAFVAAGRAPDADGGIEVHALDPETGRPVWSTRVSGGEFEGLCDYMIGGEQRVFLSNWSFDPATGEQEEAGRKARHLRGGKVGLLEASWTKHDLALRKDIQTWTANDAEGQILAFSREESAAYEAEDQELSFEGRRDWSVKIAEPAQVTGLALTNTHVVAAVAADREDSAAGGSLRLFDRETGRVVASAELSAEPAFDGLAIAGGRVYVATQDGQLHCFGASAE